MSILRGLVAAKDYATMAFGFTLLAVMSFVWGVASVVFLAVLPAGAGRRAGRLGAMMGFRAYLAIMKAVGALRLDLVDIDSLRDQGPLIVAPNHPTLIDAVLVVSRLPDAMCVMKASLLGNFLLGPGARLARYIRNDTLLGLAKRAGEELRHGGHLVLFPEGTRTVREPVGPFTAAAAVIASRTGVPVQTVFIEADSRALGKGWPARAPFPFPLYYRARLGRRFAPPKDVRAFTVELESYFMAELGGMKSPAGPVARAPAIAGTHGNARDRHG